MISSSSSLLFLLDWNSAYQHELPSVNVILVWSKHLVLFQPAGIQDEVSSHFTFIQFIQFIRYYYVRVAMTNLQHVLKSVIYEEIVC